jgi:hypothetical protein
MPMTDNAIYLFVLGQVQMECFSHVSSDITINSCNDCQNA